MYKKILFKFHPALEMDGTCLFSITKKNRLFGVSLILANLDMEIELYYKVFRPKKDDPFKTDNYGDMEKIFYECPSPSSGENFMFERYNKLKILRWLIEYYYFSYI